MPSGINSEAHTSHPCPNASTLPASRRCCLHRHCCRHTFCRGDAANDIVLLSVTAATLPRRVARGGKAAAPPEGIALAEIGHLADLVAVFAEKTVKRARPAP